MIAPRRQVPVPGERVDLDVRHYGEAEGQFMLYDDDGETFRFERGEYSWTRLSVTRDTSGALHGAVARSEGQRPFGYAQVTWTMMPGK